MAHLAAFRYLYFERIDPEANENRYYWQETLLGPGVLRIWGRKGETQWLAVTPYPSLAEAWPAIRATIRARLRRGYALVEEGGRPPSPARPDDIAPTRYLDTKTHYCIITLNPKEGAYQWQK